jgi:hypothetical protein
MREDKSEERASGTVFAIPSFIFSQLVSFLKVEEERSKVEYRDTLIVAELLHIRFPCGGVHDKMNFAALPRAAACAVHKLEVKLIQKM